MRVTARTKIGPGERRSGCGYRCRLRGRGFTVVDVLVSIAVVAVLIGLLMPSLSLVRETTRRVVCSSNIRQHGLGLALYTDDYRGWMPPSIFLTGSPSSPTARPQEMMSVRPTSSWDGLGLLFGEDYLPAAGVYYCPSHWGDHPFERYASLWLQPNGQIVSNYHFRGVGPDGSRMITRLPSRTALIADGLRTQSDFNHRIGSNVLRADMSVLWFQDNSGSFEAMLPEGETDGLASRKVGQAWQHLDTTTAPH